LRYLIQSELRDI